MQRFLLGIVVMLVSGVWAGQAFAADDPKDCVESKYKEIQAVVAKYPQKAAMQKGIRDVMETFVDYRELSRRTLSDRWDGMNKKDQDAFVAEFKKMIQRTYVKRFNPEKEVRIEYKGSQVSDKDNTAIVQSIVRSGRSEARVDYRFHRVKESWWAFDVVIDDVSMVQNYRKQFHDIWGKVGYEGLMAKLRKKNAAAGES